MNGVPVRRGGLLGRLLCVMATPHDDEVIAGGPVHRRRLVDLLLGQISPAYYYIAQRYVRTVLQRNRLLRESRGDGVEPWDEQLVTLGAAITLRRRNLVARLADLAREIYGVLSEGREQLEVGYAPAMPGEEERELAAGGARSAEALQDRGDGARDNAGGAAPG